MSNNNNDEIYTTGSKIVYQNRWMTVREDTIGRESGYSGIYGVIDKPDFVVVLAVENDHIYLVEQYRYPVKGRYKELPQGAKEGDASAEPLAVAKAELREECGLEAQQWQYVGEQFLAYGMCSQKYHIFVAQHFTQVGQELEAEEEGLTVEKMPISEFQRLILSNEIKDAVTVNAFGLAKLHGYL